MDGPDDLGQYLSILFRADLRATIGERVHGLYMLGGRWRARGAPPAVLVPSGTDDRYVLGVPLPPDLGPEAVVAAFPTERCVAMIRAAAGVPDLDIEVIAREHVRVQCPGRGAGPSTAASCWSVTPPTG